MQNELNKEAIDRICDLMSLHRMIDAIKALRTVWPFGLREAKDFLDRYRDDVTGLRNQLYKMADLTDGMVFENAFLRIEVKGTDISFAPFLETHRFLMDVLSKIGFNPEFQESHQAFMEAAELFLKMATFDEMNELCADLMKFAGNRPCRVS